MSFKSKKIITLPLFLALCLALLMPVLAQAEEYETGSIAAKRAAEQREAIAKKAEKRKQEKAAAALKQAEPAKEVEAPKAPEAATEAAPAK